MAYYNRNFEKLDINFNNLEYLGHGHCAEVYLNGKEIIKRYFEDTITYQRINPQMFDLLKGIRNPHFIELHEIYCKINDEDINLYKKQKLEFLTSAYTAKYYEEENFEELVNCIEYLLDNFNELEKLLSELTKNNIIIDDCDAKNTVITSAGIVIIDPDLFDEHKYMLKCIVPIINKKQLLELFISILVKYSLKTDKLSELDKTNFVSKSHNLFSGDIIVTEDTCITSEISKRLSLYRNTIDYIKKVAN